MSAKIYWNENSQLADMKIARFVDQVFERMAEFHTVDKRDKAIGLSDSDIVRIKASWARELQMMTPQMVIRGGKKIRDQAYCPTLAKFTQLCKPSAEEAFSEAQISMRDRGRGQFGEWTCPAVYFAAIEFGTSDLRDKSWPQASARFSKCYERAIERQERGELEQIPEAIPVERQLENQPTSNPQRVEALVAKAIDTMKSAGGKDWAIEPGSFKATCEMLHRAKKGWIDMTIVQHNLDVGVIEANGNWFKPVGYISRGELVLV